jgi:predicted lipoprotein with Yx(FWY)xxD motif
VVGSGVDKLYLWPFWGRKVMEMEMKSFFIWPIGWHSRFDKGETVRIRTKILPFYYHYTESWKVESGSKEEKPISRYFKLWPLYSYDRDGENSELRCLALCPGRNPGPIDRNWAPLWNVYKRSRAGDKVESELLWGIYRHKKDGTKKRSFTLFPLFSWERDEGCRGWTFLNGLVGRKKNGIDTSWQLLYLFKTGKNGEEQ